MDLFVVLLSFAGLGLLLLDLAVLLWQYTEFRRGTLDRFLFGVRWHRLASLFFLIMGFLGFEFLVTILGIEPFALANAFIAIISVLMIFGLIILVQNTMDDKNGKKEEN
jgi:amino acid transporter